jgi:mannosyl-oligosaccharide alpha-1,2-mannosidase
MALGTLSSLADGSRFRTNMSRLNRRYQVFVFVAVCLVLSFYLLHAGNYHKQFLPDGLSWGLSGTKQHFRPDDNAPGSGWRQLTQQYPLTAFTPLPRDAPKQLPQVQHEFPSESEAAAAKRKERQSAVKSAFMRCWTAYKERAWMEDELAPLSGSSKKTFGGWAATLVDSLDTLWIMGLKDDFEEAVEAVTNIDFSPASIHEGTINVFETTIRYLGGFLAAYDLSGDKRLLDKAVEVGEMVYMAFDTPNRLPITRWMPSEVVAGHRQVADPSVLLAEIGSMSMEFTRLSQATGDPRWYDAVDRITRILDQSQSRTRLPGMWPVVVDAREGDFTKSNGFFSLGSMSDSTYEYFPKMHALLGGTDAVYRKLYGLTAATAIKHQLYRPMTPDNAEVLLAGQSHFPEDSETNQATLKPQSQHLVCFAGGMFALAGRLFKLPEHVDIGRKLTDGCVWTYKNSPFGIMPETFEMVPCESTTDCKWNETRWKEAVVKSSIRGVNDWKNLDTLERINVVGAETIKNDRLQPAFTTIGDRRYILRPEAIESVFILYRITGDSALLDTAWDMFTAVQDATETDIANAALSDVTTKAKDRDGPSQYDSMESFWLAETLKYFYLCFCETDVLSLDEWVFNTEAHPFKRPVPGAAWS